MLVIAHRLSTVRNADVIGVVSNGRIVEVSLVSTLFYPKAGIDCTRSTPETADGGINVVQKAGNENVNETLMFEIKTFNIASKTFTKTLRAQNDKMFCFRLDRDLMTQFSKMFIVNETLMSDTVTFDFISEPFM